MASETVTAALGSCCVFSCSSFGVLLQAKRESSRPRNRRFFFIVNWFIIIIAALRHCEERSNPDNKLFFWIASSFLLAMMGKVNERLLLRLLQRLKNLGSEFVGEFRVVFDEFFH